MRTFNPHRVKYDESRITFAILWKFRNIKQNWILFFHPFKKLFHEFSKAPVLSFIRAPGRKSIPRMNTDASFLAVVMKLEIERNEKVSERGVKLSRNHENFVGKVWTFWCSQCWNSQINWSSRFRFYERRKRDSRVETSCNKPRLDCTSNRRGSSRLQVARSFASITLSLSTSSHIFCVFF